MGSLLSSFLSPVVEKSHLHIQSNQVYTLLYDDVLSVIFSYLTLQETIRTGLTHKSWLRSSTSIRIPCKKMPLFYTNIDTIYSAITSKYNYHFTTWDMCKILTHSYMSEKYAHIAASVIKRSKSIQHIDLSQVRMGVNSFSILMSAIAENKAVSSIIARRSFCKGKIESISNCIRMNMSIISVDLSFSDFDDEDVIFFTDSIRNHPSITSINLSGTKFGSKSLQYLSSAIAKNSIITSIILRSTNYDYDQLSIIANMIKESKSITFIDLCNSVSKEKDEDKDKDKSIQIIADAFSKSTSITSIDLSLDNIGTKGYFALSNAIDSNPSIQSINLHNNSSSSSSSTENEGIKYLASSIEKSTTITSIHLGHMNKIEFEVISSIAKAIASCPSLTFIDLDIASCSINKDSIKELMSVIAKEKTDKTKTKLAQLPVAMSMSINLSFNSICNEEVQFIAHAIANSNNLTSINLSKNNIGLSGAREVASALKKSKSIKSINLNYNKLCYKGVESILLAIKDNHNIISVGLGGNCISSENVDAIKNVIKDNFNLASLDLHSNFIKNQEIISEIIEAVIEYRPRLMIEISAKYTSAGSSGLYEDFQRLKMLQINKDNHTKIYNYPFQQINGEYFRLL